MRATSASSGSSSSGSTTTRDDIYEDVYAGLVLRRLRGVQDRGRARRRQVPRPRHRARVDRGEELLLPALRLPGRVARALRRAARLRAPELPLQRGAELHRGRPAGLLDQPRGQTWGMPLPWDPSQVAYVWADALVNYLSALTLRAAGRGSRARSGRRVAHPGQGHPPLPLRLLAGDAARRRLRGAAAALRARLPGSTSRRSRSRSGTSIDPLDLIDVYGVDAVRFWCARAGLVRPGRERHARQLHERYERELGNDLGNLLSRTTAMIARYRDGPARDGRPGRAPFDADALRETSSSGSTAGTSPARSTRSGMRVREPQPARRDDGAVGARQGRVAKPTSSTACSTTSPTASSRSPSRWRRTSPRRAPRILEALGQPADLSLGARRRAGRPRPADGIEPAPPLFPRVDAPRRCVIDTHAHSTRSTTPPDGRSPVRERPASAASSRSARRSTLPRGARARRAARRGLRDPRHPPARGRRDAGGAASASSRALLAHPRAVAVGETGLDYYRDYAPRDAQQRAVRAAARARRRSSGKPVVDPHPRRRRGHARRARRLRRHGRPPLLLRRPRCSPSRSSAATTSRSPAT